MENPNEYNDDAFVRASLKLISAVRAMWEAGGSLEDIAQGVSSALENAEVDGVFVDITAG